MKTNTQQKDNNQKYDALFLAVTCTYNTVFRSCKVICSFKGAYSCMVGIKIAKKAVLFAINTKKKKKKMKKKPKTRFWMTILNFAHSRVFASKTKSCGG